MTLPEPDQIQAKIERLLDLVLPPNAPKAPITKNIARLLDHVQLERTQPSRPDGYPTRASATDPNGGSGRHDDADVKLTGVEATVVAKQHWRDPHTTKTEAAIEYLYDAVHAIAALDQTLDKLDELGTTNHRVAYCENHLNHGIDRVPRRGDGSVVCDACSDFRRRYGALPNLAIIQYADRLGWGRLPEMILRKQFAGYRAKTATPG